MKIRFTGHTRPPARDIIIAVLAILLIVTTGVVVNYWYGSRDDVIAGPGCTWGDEHCDVVDYVHNCENADPTPDPMGEVLPAGGLQRGERATPVGRADRAERQLRPAGK